MGVRLLQIQLIDLMQLEESETGTIKAAVTQTAGLVQRDRRSMAVVAVLFLILVVALRVRI